MLDRHAAHSPAVDRINQELAHRSSLADDHAWAMPAEFYTSEDFLEVEINDVLRRDWMCIGHIGELHNPGDFFTTELLGEQLLAVHDTDGVIRVLSNVCRHRGNRVAEGTGNAKSLSASTILGPMIRLVPSKLRRI